MGKKISIIIPVYNTEKYLSICIESILNQSYKNIEVILIDDGSTDSSGIICDKYATRDERIKVFHKENEGVSKARNMGLNNASGEYITFVDSDDWIDKDMYRTMMDIVLVNDIEVVMCDCIKEDSGCKELYSHDIREGYYNYEQLKKEYYKHLIMMENVEFPPTISNCLCIFKSSVIQDNQIKYIEGIKYSEDLLFGVHVMLNVKSFYYMKGQAPYHYRMRSDSASHRFDENAWSDHVNLCKEAEKLCKKYDFYDFRSQINLMWLFFVYNSVGEISREKKWSIEKRETKIKEILQNENVIRMFHDTKVLNLPISFKLKIRTLMYKYRIAIRLIIK